MSYFKPATILALEQLGLIKRWRRIEGGGVYVELVEGFNISGFANFREPAGGLSMDLKDHFIAGLQVLTRDEMNEAGVELYRRLKGFETVLEYRGLLRNKPLFVPRPVLKKISPSIEVNPALADRLNGDAELMKLVKRVKPASFRILLKSVDELLASQERDPIEVEREYYSDPIEVAWVIAVSAILPRGPGLKRNVRGIVEMIDRAAAHIKDLTKSLIESSL